MKKVNNSSYIVGTNFLFKVNVAALIFEVLDI